MSPQREYQWKVTGWKAAVIWFVFLGVLSTPAFIAGLVIGRLA